MGDDWMQLWVNAAQMKAADQYTIQKLGVPSLELMEHAAQACVQVLEDEKVDLSHVCVVCGSGNNGGDGFAIARILQNNRYSVETFLCGKPGALYRGNTGTDVPLTGMRREDYLWNAAGRLL